VEDVGTAPGRASASGLFCARRRKRREGELLAGCEAEAASSRYRGQHVVLSLPRDSGCDVIASLPEGGEGEVGDEPDREGGGDEAGDGEGEEEAGESEEDDPEGAQGVGAGE
jgi:hypothetical protein